MDSTEDVIQDIIEALTSQGLTVELSHPELGWGQQELSTRHAPGAPRGRQPGHLPPDRARGRVAARPRRVARARSRSRTRRAAAPTSTGASGTRRTRPTGSRTRTAPTGSARSPGTPSRACIAHLPGLLGLTTPSVNSFRRLQPHYWSSAYTAWGIENREAAVRVPSRYWDDEAGSTNLELKASDASANPYISLGGVMAAALDGIERGLDPGDPVDVDPGNLTDDERARRGIRRFPETASEALDELEKDEVLVAAPRRAARDRVPQGASRRGRRVRRAGRRVRARAPLLQVLTGPSPCPSTSRRSRSSTTTATRCSARQPADDDAFRIHLTETYFPEVARDDVPHTLFYQWTIRELAGLLDCEPTPDAVHAARRARGREALAREVVERANFKTWLIDTGYGADTTFSLDELRAIVPCRIEEVLRLEPMIERLILEATDFDGLHRRVPGVARRTCAAAASSASSR